MKWDQVRQVGHGISTALSIPLIAYILNHYSVLYSLLDGRPLTTLDISFLNIDPTSIQTWQISDDLKTLLTIFQSGDLIYVDLVNSVKDWSDFLLREKNPTSESEGRKRHSKPASSHLHTCNIGDSSWRDRLTSLHHGTRVERKFTKNRKATDASLERRKRVDKQVTGFRSKDKRLSTAVTSGFTSIVAPQGLHGYSVDAISIGISTLTLVYTYNDVSVLSMCTIQTGSWSIQRWVYCT